MDKPAAQTSESSQEIVQGLRGWTRAKEAASRYNRNLLQFGAGIAAVLGIEAGSGGIFALANSIVDTGNGGSLPWWALLHLAIVSIGG